MPYINGLTMFLNSLCQEDLRKLMITWSMLFWQNFQFCKSSKNIIAIMWCSFHFQGTRWTKCWRKNKICHSPVSPFVFVAEWIQCFLTEVFLVYFSLSHIQVLEGSVCIFTVQKKKSKGIKRSNFVLQINWYLLVWFSFPCTPKCSFENVRTICNP